MFFKSYSWGYKSRAAAQSALHEEISEGRLTESDCKIAFYRTTEGKPRWQILELVAS